MGEYKKSVDALKTGLKIAEESIQLRKNPAVTYIRMKDYEEAIIALEAIPEEIREKTGESRYYSDRPVTEFITRIDYFNLSEILSRLYFPRPQITEESELKIPGRDLC